MLGKWMLTQFDGNALTTNEKVVYTFESDTIGYVSASKVDYSETQPKWTYRAKSFITVNGNKISMYGNLNKTTSFVAELEVKSISETEIVAEMEYTMSGNSPMTLSLRVVLPAPLAALMTKSLFFICF